MNRIQEKLWYDCFAEECAALDIEKGRKSEISQKRKKGVSKPTPCGKEKSSYLSFLGVSISPAR